MEKMLKKMSIDDSKMSTLRRKQQAMEDSSDDDEDMANPSDKKEAPEPTPEEIQDMSTRLSEFEKMDAAEAKPAIPKKAKPLPRTYYQELKKRLRRKLRAGLLPDMAKID
mmetsp:Transcript_34991/g.53712  ORF Transcript_34991/g.53712 Transcript_34991/m.53712 type:complete len:110 (-) Transcript_34991:87-416(-)